MLIIVWSRILYHFTLQHLLRHHSFGQTLYWYKSIFCPATFFYWCRCFITRQLGHSELTPRVPTRGHQESIRGVQFRQKACSQYPNVFFFKSLSLCLAFDGLLCCIRDNEDGCVVGSRQLHLGWGYSNQQAFCWLPIKGGQMGERCGSRKVCES